jgi:chromate transporter
VSGESMQPKAARAAEVEQHSLADFVRYFLGLGTFGFGGPIALAGFMRRDLVDKRRWVTEDDYGLGMALAQMMPGPLAAQLAIALGYFRAGVLGATLVGLVFVLPSWLMVLGLSVLYVNFGGLWWMQALFYSIGATVIAIIAIAAYKLARSTNKKDPFFWGIFAVLAAVTAWPRRSWPSSSSWPACWQSWSRPRPPGSRRGCPSWGSRRQ